MKRFVIGAAVMVVGMLSMPQQASADEPSDWLDAVNAYRAVQDSSLPSIVENSDWSEGDRLHARYIVETGQFGHTEDPSNPWYTEAGATAGSKSNVAGCTGSEVGNVNLWMEGPFHAIGILDPQLRSSGYGEYSHNGCASALDVIRGLTGPALASDAAPLVFPGNGSAVAFTRFGGGEYPNPLSSCSFNQSTNALMFQFPAGGALKSATLTRDDGASIETCAFDGNTYVNSDGTAQQLGRDVLRSRNAVAVMGNGSFEPGRRYTAAVTVGDVTATSTFLITCGESTAKRTGYTTVLTAPGQGACPYVRGYNDASQTVGQGFFPFTANFRGGVHVAAGDVNSDGIADYLAGAGPGGTPHVVVVSGLNGSVIRSFLAYGSNFTGGVNLATGDFNNDGYDDIVTGAGPGGTPHVQVIDGASGAVMKSFLAYNEAFRGGVDVAVGDVNGDAHPDIITAAGAGGTPHVLVFDGVTGAVIRSFLAYSSTFSGGVDVAAADLDNDSYADIITGAGPGGSPHVIARSGKTGDTLASFYAYGAGFAGGVHVGAGTATYGDGREIVTGPGAGGGPHVRVFSGTGSPLKGWFAYTPSTTSGVEVAVPGQRPPAPVID